MKKQRIEIRVSSLEKKLLEKKASNCGLSISEYIRRTAFGLDVRYKLTEDEIEVFKMLHKYKMNFDSISNMYKKRNPQINNEVRLVISEITNQLKKFQK